MLQRCKVYVSCPLSVDFDILQSYIRSLTKIEGTRVFVYERGTKYSDQELIASDIFVTIFESNKFSCRTIDLTPGCKKELEIARNMGKPIFVGYISRDNGPRFYLAEILLSKVGGIAGSVGRLQETIDAFNSAKQDYKLIEEAMSDSNTSKWNPTKYGYVAQGSYNGLITGNLTGTGTANACIQGAAASDEDFIDAICRNSARMCEADKKKKRGEDCHIFDQDSLQDQLSKMAGSTTLFDERLLLML